MRTTPERIEQIRTALSQMSAEDRTREFAKLSTDEFTAVVAASAAVSDKYARKVKPVTSPMAHLDELGEELRRRSP
jgi:hypothetical protein